MWPADALPSYSGLSLNGTILFLHRDLELDILPLPQSSFPLSWTLAHQSQAKSECLSVTRVGRYQHIHREQSAQSIFAKYPGKYLAVPATLLTISCNLP